MYYKETLFYSEKNVVGVMLNNSIKRDKALSQDFKTRKILRIKWNKQEKIQKKKFIEIIILVKKISVVEVEKENFERKTYLF